MEKTGVSAVDYRIVKEGETQLLVPLEEGPVKFPSFFNPQGRFVREVSIVCYKAFADSTALTRSDLTFADSLAGTGARGIRVAKEVPEFIRVYLNDISSTSLDLARRSAITNGVEEKCVFSKSEACAFLSSRQESLGERFDVVDVDPFGTPSPFVDCALRATRHGGMLSISATDTAVLCGVYPQVAQRKYLGLPVRTDYAHEVGMRLMFGLLAMTAMRFESSIQPLFCHHDMHYFRIYCTVEIGNRYSRQNEEEIGFVLHCFRCGYRSIMPRHDLGSKLALKAEGLECPSCHEGILKLGGPLWIGRIQLAEFVERCGRLSELSIFQPELDQPLYYDIATLSDEMGLRTPKIGDVISELKSTGHSASRTRLDPTAVRTDAPLEELRKLVAQLSR
jgi:tRNA (guanine26-N2/guanine27-N2)-dimethyltransferase